MNEPPGVPASAIGDQRKAGAKAPVADLPPDMQQLLLLIQQNQLTNGSRSASPGFSAAISPRVGGTGTPPDSILDGAGQFSAASSASRMANHGFSQSMPNSNGILSSGSSAFLDLQQRQHMRMVGGVRDGIWPDRANGTVPSTDVLFLEQRMRWELGSRENSSDSLDDLDSARMVDWVLENDAGFSDLAPMIGSPLDPKAPTFTPTIIGSAPSGSRDAFGGHSLVGPVGFRDNAGYSNRRLLPDGYDGDLPFEMTDLDATSAANNPSFFSTRLASSSRQGPGSGLTSSNRTHSQSALTSALAGLGGGASNFGSPKANTPLDDDILSMSFGGGGKAKFGFGSAPQTSSVSAAAGYMSPQYSGMSRQQQEQMILQHQQQQRGLPIPGTQHANQHLQPHLQQHLLQQYASSFDSPSSPIAIDRLSLSAGGGASSYRQGYPTGSSWAPSSYASSYGGAPSSLSSDEGLSALAARYNASFPTPQQMQMLQQQQAADGRNKRSSLRGRDQSVIGMVAEVADDGCPVLRVPRLPIWGMEGAFSIPHRVWKKGGTEKADSRHFMIMSYNVLAPLYCTESRYNKSVKQHLVWESRRKKILDEIAFYAPDFVCLQELPPADFKEVFLTELSKIGYDGHFQAKKKDHAADGCAIFYLEARFTLMAVQAFAYSDQINADPGSDLHTRLAPFPNICLVCVFQNRQARSLRVRVVNTHLHWDPAFADTKLLQAAILMEWLERTHRDVPTVIAADLNSRAGEAVVDYLVRGKVAPGALFGDKDFGRFTASLVTRVAGGGLVPVSVAQSLPPSEFHAHHYHHHHSINAPPGSSVPTVMPNPPLPLLRHGTKLASAYDRKDLAWTNKTPDFEGSIDHILYTSGTLSIRDVLGDLDPSGNPVATSATSTSAAGVSSPEVSSTSSSPIPQIGPEDLANSSIDDVDLSATDLDSATSPPGMMIDVSNSQTPTDITPTPTPTTAGSNMPTPFPLIAGIPYMVPQHQQPQGNLSRVQHLPEEHFPSDHIPLIAWLKWKTVPVGTGPPTPAPSAASASSATSSQSMSVNIGAQGRNRGGRRGNGPIVQQQLNAGLFAGGGGQILSSSAPVPRGGGGAAMMSAAIGAGSPFGIYEGGNRPPLPGGNGGIGGIGAGGALRMQMNGVGGGVIGGGGGQVGSSGGSVNASPVGRKPSLSVVGGISIRRK